MPPAPPAHLVDLLSRCELVRSADLRAAGWRAWGLSRDLAQFDAVWVDALVRSRALTPYQATEIQAGRGEKLRCGPFVLREPLPAPVYGQAYRARRMESSADLRLIIAAAPESADRLPEVERLIERSSRVGAQGVVPIEQCGIVDGRLWVSSPLMRGRTASDWLVHGGRMPPDVVLEIARQLAATLVVCQSQDLLHGDICAQQLLLDPLGHAMLLEPGLRTILRPHEGDQAADLPPAAYDSLAPERLLHDSPVSGATEIYACGMLWRHLLCGLSPLVGATAVARRQAASAPRLAPIEHVEPDTPRALVEAIRRATEPDGGRRPATFTELLEVLGPPSDRGQALVARYVARGASSPELLMRRIHGMRRSPHAPTWAAAASGVVLACALGTWPLWQSWVVREPVAAPMAAAPKTAAATSPDAKTPVASAVATPRSVKPRQDSSPNVEVASNVAEPSKVVPASATAPIPTPPIPGSREFLISADRPIAWDQFRPRPGQIVRARAGERATVVLPPGGGELAAEGIRCEDIDFIMPHAAAGTRAAITLISRRVTFTRCSFQMMESVEAAVLCSASAAGTDPTTTGELTMRQCVIVGQCGAVSTGQPGESTIALDDVLHLGDGPLLTVEPLAMKSLNVRLNHCTVRDANSVVCLRGGLAEREIFKARVEAKACVFALRRGAPVLQVAGGDSPAALLRTISWIGEGSVVAPQVAIVLWQPAGGQPRAVADTQFSIEGLVRTELGFAGPATAGPDASRLVRWQVPLRSSLPPGITDAPLPPLAR